MFKFSLNNSINLKFNKVSLFNAVLFSVSPFLAIPSILIGVINKSKFSLQLLVLLFGIVSYIFVPNLSDDRARYFELYENFQNSSYVELFAYLMIQGQDFILQSMFYIASQYNISAQYVFAIVTIISMSLIFSIYYKITQTEVYTTKEDRFYAIILLCLAIPYIDLFSGTRFMFANSFVLLAFYIGLIEKKKSAFLLLVIASFIHFSTLVFIPIFSVLYFFPNSDKKYIVLFLISIFFLIIPASFILSLFNLFGFSGGLAVKQDAYLEGDDFIQNAINESYIAKIAFLLEMLFITISYVFLVFFSKSKGVFKNMVLFSASVINIFYSVPTIFFRYVLFLKLLFVFFLIHEIYSHKQKTWGFLFASILIGIFFFQIISGLPNIIETFLNKDVILLLQIILKNNMSPNDFIQ